MNPQTVVYYVKEPSKERTSKCSSVYLAKFNGLSAATLDLYNTFYLSFYPELKLDSTV
jgi:hypothetical protein